jgi:prophage regulatory protein
MDALKPRRAPIKDQDKDVAQLPDAMLRVTTVAEILGIGKSTLWEWVKKGEFPRPRALGRHLVRWRAGDVMQWCRDREAADRRGRES